MRPSPDQVRQLVCSVARRGGHSSGLVIEADNTGGGWQPVAQLLSTDTCFAVLPDVDVLALDADSSRAVEGVQRVVRELQSRGIPYVRLESGGPGREHLFARVRSPQTRANLSELARRHGVDVRESSPIRPPGVRHRSGALPQLLHPASWDAAVEALAPRAQPHQVVMSPRLARLVREGDTERTYHHDDGRPDRSALTLAICSYARAEGLTLPVVERLLADPRHVGGAGYRSRAHTRGETKARWWLNVVWSKTDNGGKRVSGGVDPVVVAELEEDLAEFLALPHPGQRGNSQVAVYVAAVRIAQRDGKRRTPLSVRQLAEESGKDTKTVRAALSDLRTSGHLEIAEAFHLDRATVWEITRKVPTDLRRRLGGCESGGTSRVSLGHDAFAHGALGTGAWRVLSALDTDESQTAAEISERLGVCVGTIRRHLHRLNTAGLAVHTADGWAAAVLSEVVVLEVLDAVALQRMTAGRRARRHRRFAQERQALREALTSLDDVVAARVKLGLRRRSRRIHFHGIVAGRRAA